MKIAAALSLMLMFAGCAEERAPAASEDSAAIAIEDSTPVSEDVPIPVASYAPLEANGLPGQAAVVEVLGKKCPGRVPEIRQVTCEGFDEEPTEFSCTFERRQDDGSWKSSAMTIAIDGRYGWLDIGGPECNINNLNFGE